MGIVFDSLEKTIEGVDEEERPYSKTYTGENGGGTNVVERGKLKLPRITEAKRAELLKKYETVVVNDYNDDFHMSDEERQKKDKYYEYQKLLGKCKTGYRKLDEYVKSFRINMEALNAIAEDNQLIYSKSEFIKKVLNKEIKVYGLKWPKYNGKGKKDINWKVVSEYILDTSKDPKDLLRTKKEGLEIEAKTDEEVLHYLFSDEDLEEIEKSVMKELTDEDSKEIMYMDDETFAEDGKYIVHPSTKRELKKVIDSAPSMMREFTAAIREEKKNQQLAQRLEGFSYDVISSDFDEIAEMDAEYLYHSESDMPEFNGDIMNDEDYKKYLYQLSNFERESVKVENDKGKLRTQEEMDIDNIKDMLQDAGWNVRKMYYQKEEQRKLKKALRASYEEAYGCG